MAEITDIVHVPLRDLLADVTRYKYNPTNIQRVILDYLEKVTSGQVNIVDPTNPFVFLLESSCVNTAAANIESEINLRKLYPVLAQSLDDLYIHMSDVDFANIFATPAKTKFTFLIQFSSLIGQMVPVPDTNYKKITIARNTEVVADGMTFSLQYPIDIKQFENGVIQISYDNTTQSPLQKLSTNTIPYTLKKDANNIEWIQFNVEMTQFKITSSHYALQASSIFNRDIPYEDSYYFARIFYKKGVTNTWKEMRTSLTDQVYDPFTPTAILKPNDQTKLLNVFIPPIYLNSGLIDGNIRIDIYQTRGTVSLDMSNLTLNKFSTTLLALDEENDITVYSNAMNHVSYIAYSAEFVNGGTNPLSFETLRQRVIDNAVGAFETPITNVQLIATAEREGFSIVKNVDVVTNRIFLATRSLPNPNNTNLITAANVTVGTLITSMNLLATLDSVFNNTNRMTIASKTLYQNVNGRLSIVEQSQIEAIKALPALQLCAAVNASNFLYSPFYYVLDNAGDEFEVRAYHLDAPEVRDLNFINQNTSTEVRVNTNTYSIQKTATGYELVVEVSSDDFYKELEDQYVFAQLSYVPYGEINRAFVNGVLVGKNGTTNERIFKFTIDTNFDLDSDDRLVLTNFEMFANEFARTLTSLENTFTILYATNSVPVGFINDEITNKLGKFKLPADTVGITEESILIEFGAALNNLWTRSRSVADGARYQTYTEDIPMLYTEDVYDIDPETGAALTVDAQGNVTYNILHHAGDPVLDNQGEVVYSHRIGDVVLGPDGKPVAISDTFTSRHIDLLLVDGSYYFVTEAAYSAYREEIADVITTWVTHSLSNIENQLLEQSEIFFHPTSAIGLVQVMLSQGLTTTIEAKQSFQVTLYVPNIVFNDFRIREQLTKTTIQTLNKILQNRTISVSDMIVNLREACGESVVSASIEGLGGQWNYETVTLMKENESLSLNKRLVVQDDGSLIVVEDVAISFVEYTTK